MNEIEAKSYLEDIRALKQHPAWERFSQQVKFNLSEAAERVVIEKMTQDKAEALKDVCRAYHLILNIEENAEALLPKEKKETGVKPVY